MLVPAPTKPPLLGRVIRKTKKAGNKQGQNAGRRGPRLMAEKAREGCFAVQPRLDPTCHFGLMPAKTVSGVSSGGEGRRNDSRLWSSSLEGTAFFQVEIVPLNIGMLQVFPVLLQSKLFCPDFKAPAFK